MNRSITTIAIGTAVLTFASVLPMAATASDAPQSSYEVVVAGKQAFGDLIVKGQYQQAIQRITGRPVQYPFAAATNLCVAYTMLDQLDQATPYCNQAIKLAEANAKPMPRHWKGRAQVQSNQALAHSNRGVLRVLSGDGTGAAEDFRAAIELREEMRAPVHNFARLNMSTSEPVALEVSQ